MKQNNSQTQLPTRTELDRFEPYQGGLSIDQIKRQYGLKEIVKLASNENPLGPSPDATKAYKKAVDDIFRYPESNCFDLRRLISDKYGLDISEVLVGAGSDEVIELLAKAFLTPEDNIVVSQSSFIQYSRAGHLMGAKVIEVPMKDMKHDLVAMAEAIDEKTKFVFIANPNNPTGTYNTREEMEKFLSTIPKTVLPVVDEAYFEYAAVKEDYPSMIKEFSRRFEVVVLRTFSKIYGLAGLRVGYGVGPEWCIQALDRIRPPFNVSIPAQKAAAAALYDESFVKKSVNMNETEKEKLVQELAEIGFRTISSAANFLLLNVRPLNGKALFHKILQKGVITRAVDEYGLPDYLRVTVGKPAENKKFLKILREVMDQK